MRDEWENCNDVRIQHKIMCCSHDIQCVHCIYTLYIVAITDLIVVTLHCVHNLLLRVTMSFVLL